MKNKFAVLKKKTAKAEVAIQEISKLMDDEDLKIRKNMDVINASTVCRLFSAFCSHRCR